MAGIFSFLKSGNKTPLFGKKQFDEKITKRFNILEILGSGGFSEVHLGEEITSGKRYAVKCISKKNLKKLKEGLANIEGEVNILRKLNHKNIVGLVDLIDNKDALYIVLDLVSGGELFDRIVARGSYTERDASEIVKQLLEAMSYVHSVGVVHRDLKPENLLYQSHAEDANIMVTDFGLAKMADELSSQTSACGTPGYVAPEVLYLKPYGAAVDCWGIGVITYILLCGYPPFYDDEQRDEIVYQQIMRADYEFDSPYWDDISNEAKDFISKLMEFEPSSRLTCDQALQHTWICGDSTADKDLLSTVAEQIKRFRTRAKWKKAVIATNFIERMKKMNLVGSGADETQSASIVEDEVENNNKENDESMTEAERT